ncbi:MAG: YbaB/EbfC family nucleoid-associated protein [Acidobacteria bacterium]|nr:YbaB/EbfC family nucleoid-associated protein [Acidobacteriota bacterium]
MDMRFLMRQAQQMQAKLQEAQQKLRVEGTAGGEAVRIVMNGAKEVQEVRIAKEACDPEDPSMLEDLILAAFKDAVLKADEGMKQVTGGMAGAAGIPGLGL